MTISRRKALTLVTAAPLAAAVPATTDFADTPSPIWIRVRNPLDDGEWEKARKEALEACFKQMSGHDGPVAVMFHRYLKATARAWYQL